MSELQAAVDEFVAAVADRKALRSAKKPAQPMTHPTFWRDIFAEAEEDVLATARVDRAWQKLYALRTVNVVEAKEGQA